jgi:hypothetical protein
MFEGHLYLERHGICYDSVQRSVRPTVFAAEVFPNRFAHPANKFSITFGMPTFIAVCTTARNWSAV